MSIPFRLPLGPVFDALAAGRDEPQAGADTDARAEEAAALRTLAAAGREDPDPDYDFILGRALLRAGRLEEAVRRCQSAITLACRHAEYHYTLGCALWQLGRLEDAAAAFAGAVQLEPGDAHALLALGATLARLGRHTEATAKLETALASDSKLAEVHAVLGAVRFEEGHVREAVAHLRRAARLRPESPEVRANLGLALLHSGHTREALRLLREAVRHAPDDARARLDLAEAAVAAGLMDEASEAFARAAQLDPRCIAGRPSSLAARDTLALVRAHEEIPGRTRPTLAHGICGFLLDAVTALWSLLGLGGRTVRWLAIGAALVALVLLARLAPPYVMHFLLTDDITVVARAPVETDAEVRDRLDHAVAARGMQNVLDTGRCSVATQAAWRRIACAYDVPLTLLPGLRRTLTFRIEVEQPFVIPRD